MQLLRDALASAAPADAIALRNQQFAQAYSELRALARHRLRDGGRVCGLDTTVLVHETYLRFQPGGDLRTDDRRAFLAYASQVMRSVIVDAVRERQALRRGGGMPELTLDTAALGALSSSQTRVLQVHEALLELERAEPRLAQVVEMRYFGGYNEREIGAALNLTERTVRRDWDKARLLLMALLSNS